MFTEISYSLFFGRPLILWLGIATLLAILVTAAVPFLNRRGIHIIPSAWHPWCAAAAIALALVHGTLGILAYL